MLEKSIPFSQEILVMYYYELCNKNQVNVMEVFMKSYFAFYVTLTDSTLGLLSHFGCFRGHFSAFCL